MSQVLPGLSHLVYTVVPRYVPLQSKQCQKKRQSLLVFYFSFNNHTVMCQHVAGDIRTCHLHGFGISVVSAVILQDTVSTVAVSKAGTSENAFCCLVLFPKLLPLLCCYLRATGCAPWLCPSVPLYSAVQKYWTTQIQMPLFRVL